MRFLKYLPDGFTLSLIATIAVASLLPCYGTGMVVFNGLTNVAVALLFFLHGAKLSRESALSGLTHWRLHLVVLLSTFVMFPLLGLILQPIFKPMLTPALYMGVLFLCTLPSTVQSSIAFTSMARGNVPAAVCAASASSLLGIFITPALVALLGIGGGGSTGSAWHTVGNITLQLFVPFVAGQLMRPLLAAWLDKHKGILRFVDRGSILLVVYVAFSEAVNEGIWQTISLPTLGSLLLVNAVLLVLALWVTIFASKRLGFDRADQITIIFCGSKKSLASGVPMAKVIFASNTLGAIVLPLMLFHQIQLMTCAVLAQRWGAKVPQKAD